jgi:hypothetical protein
VRAGPSLSAALLLVALVAAAVGPFGVAGCDSGGTLRSLCEEASDGVCNRLATCGPVDLNKCVDDGVAACCQATDCSAPRPASTQGCIDALGTISCDQARAGTLPAACQAPATVSAGY